MPVNLIVVAIWATKPEPAVRAIHDNAMFPNGRIACSYALCSAVLSVPIINISTLDVLAMVVCPVTVVVTRLVPGALPKSNTRVPNPVAMVYSAKMPEPFHTTEISPPLGVTGIFVMPVSRKAISGLVALEPVSQ